MNEWVKNILTSTVAAGLVSWLATSYTIEQELHSKQSESGYEALVKANTKAWQAKAMEKENGYKNEALVAEIEKLKRESAALYIVARQKIAAFGDERVVKAMSDFYKYRSLEPCSDKELFTLDTQIYRSIRETLGVGGVTDGVDDEHLANLMFLCSLK